MNQWSDEGVMIGARRHGESSLIVEMLTRDHGRHLGMVRGGSSKRLKPQLQGGNSLSLVWKARLDEHLGHYSVEMTRSRSFEIMSVPGLALAFQSAASHVRRLPERDPEPGLHDALIALIEGSSDALGAAELLARYELGILEAVGFGLDLSACAVTGSSEGLAYVSPKTGRAVGLEAGAEWSDRLLRLPPFMLERKERPSGGDVVDALKLSGHFLDRNVYGPGRYQLPVEREMLVRLLGRSG